MRRIDRLDKYLSFKGITEYRATIDAALSKGTIGKSRAVGRDLSNKVVEKLVEVYSDLNKVWLLTGEGEMLKNNSAVADNHSISIAGDEVKENEINVNTDSAIANLIAEVSAQRKLTESTLAEITEQRKLTEVALKQNSELIALLKGKNETVS